MEKREGKGHERGKETVITGVAVSLDGSRVYVADSGNHRIKVRQEKDSSSLRLPRLVKEEDITAVE